MSRPAQLRANQRARDEAVGEDAGELVEAERHLELAGLELGRLEAPVVEEHVAPGMLGVAQLGVDLILEVVVDAFERDSPAAR